MNKELYTVAEFAKIAGVSKQAVYSRLDKGLKQFVQKVDGQKMLKKEALQLYDKQEVEQSNSSNLSTLDLLSKTIESLQRQLEEKDKQIERLTEALIIEQQHASQAQALHAGTIHQALEEKKEPKQNFLQRLFKHNI